MISNPPFVVLLLLMLASKAKLFLSKVLFQFLFHHLHACTWFYVLLSKYILRNEDVPWSGVSLLKHLESLLMLHFLKKLLSLQLVVISQFHKVSVQKAYHTFKDFCPLR